MLNALQDAEDALGRFGSARQGVTSALRAKAAADRIVERTRKSFQAGTIRRADMLDAEREQIAAGDSLSQARAILTTSFIALQKALGLGWSTNTGEDRAGGGRFDDRREKSQKGPPA